MTAKKYTIDDIEKYLWEKVHVNFDHDFSHVNDEGGSIMDITGIWKYSELKKQYNAVSVELDAVKKTATQLTNENNDLKRELDRLDDDYTAYYERLLGESQTYRRAFEESVIENSTVNMKLDKAEARIKELEAKASEPKWCYHLNLGWIPIEGTVYQILSKTPAMFPQFCKEKRVPEK